MKRLSKDPCSRFPATASGLLLGAAAMLAGCGPRSGLTEEQALGLAAERDDAIARAGALEADLQALQQAQLQLIEQQEEATAEADRLMASLMQESRRYQEEVELLDRQLAETRGEAFADIIRLEDGTEILCRVLDLRGNLVEVQLPDGSHKKARLTDIQRILLRSTEDFVVTPAVAPVAPTREPAAPGTDLALQLSPFWNIPLPASTRTTQALRRILGPHGTPTDDRSGRANALLFEDLYYLMPLAEAEAALDRKTAQRKEVAVPGLPKNSLFTYEYRGLFEGKFDRLLLVTDNAAQVVAVQLVEDGPHGRWLDPQAHPSYSKVYSSSLDLFNLLENRTKSNSRGMVGTRVARLGEHVIRIDSEFLSSQLNSKECVRLYIAQPVVDLILYLIETYY